MMKNYHAPELELMALAVDAIMLSNEAEEVAELTDGITFGRDDFK